MDVLTADALQELLRAADPAVLLVRSRILRRVIKRARRVRGALGQVPHRQGFVVRRPMLLECAFPWELGLATGAELPDAVILLERPSDDRLVELGRDEALVRWWRLLFHARVHMALESVDGRHRLNQAVVRERVDRIGQTAFDEIRSVLDEEHLLFERRNERDEYVEFVATFLEFRAFAPHLLRRYFPTLADDAERLSVVVAADIDAAAIFGATRPAGAPDPLVTHSEEGVRPERARRGRRAKARRGYGEEWQKKLVSRAERREARGNVVRGAILRQSASVSTERIDPDAADAIGRLVRRMKAALAFDAEVERRWRSLLQELLPRASSGFRTPEAKLLYDLQRVCVDHERGLHTIDLIEWARTLGRRPLKRALPHQREVLMCRHLRAAHKRLVAVRIPETDRGALDELVKGAEHLAEQRLRRRCRPEIEELLDEAGFRPATVVERVARGKLVDEVLDRVATRGFLSLGDVRDALSRNQLKLGDCHRFSDFWSASRLLKVDRGLGRALDGVYRRGEVYLRWLQRVSSLAFGTELGRWLARYLVIPFGGAFIVLRGLQEMLHPLAALLDAEIHLVDRWHISVLTLGVYLLGLMYVARVRDLTVGVLSGVGRGFRAAFWRWPRHLAALPTVRAFLNGAFWRWTMRILIKPVALAAVVSVPRIWLVDASAWWKWALGLLAIAEVALNSPVGTTVEEISTDLAWRTWHGFRGTFIVGFVRFVLWLFRTLLDALERTLYAVDEWLRFRSGQGRITFVVKAILGAVWWVVTWILRVYVNLLIEPQVNPVKHFPVVTVSHKLMLPFIPVLIGAVNRLLEPALGAVVANAISWSTVTLLPGFFGFLVWELKENWRLYAANRSEVLKPVIVGGHGETVLRLMKPGFHSGTLPKAYARLRKAERKSRWTGAFIPARKQREVLLHVEHDIAHWVERELLALLSDAAGWGGAPVEIARVDVGSNRIRVALSSSSDGADLLVLSFEEQSGWLVAQIAEPGWLPALDARRRAVLHDALCGLYHTAGVGFVREDVEHRLGSPTPPYDIADQGLVVWPGPGYEHEEVRDLEPLLLGRAPVLWADWVAAWEVPRDEQQPHILLEDVRLLPG
ncbi:MAG: hypothetical protein VX913_11255 [Planctomycetota bacterium]|nr:hypothetical protein [Planctomycetota bacterium]